jgi:predicted 2-oxoglutarate/Fe(II)-dependent dioxygenase YbiX
MAELQAFAKPPPKMPEGFRGRMRDKWRPLFAIARAAGGEWPMRARAAAGELFLYPSTTLHRVTPVTGGVRLAAVGWVRSFVRDPGQRELLFDLETALRAVFARDGKSPLFDTLVKTRTNLLRMWADD